ncbi:MAG: WG repeat-containing protein [Bacteroidota bacterium]
MRLVSILLLLLVTPTFGVEYTVFKKGPYYGIMSADGEVLVPAIYSRLGWSDGSEEFKAGIIGFEEGGAWGLISIKNKIVSPAKYHSLSPLNSSFLKASIQGKLSNHLYYGLLDHSGKIKISFHYFSLDTLGDQALLISDFDRVQKYGLLSFDNNRMIPAKYQTISKLDELYCAKRFDQSIDVYTLDGSLLVAQLDQIELLDEGQMGILDGRAGYLKNGQILKDFLFKDFRQDEQGLKSIHFPKWSIYKGDTFQFSLRADSIAWADQGFWLAYLNGVLHYTSRDSLFYLKDHVLREANEKNLFLKHQKTGLWSVRSIGNQKIASGFDSVFAAQYGFWGKKEECWALYNRYGKRKSGLSFNDVFTGVGSQFVVRLKDHWAIMDPLGKLMTPLKYDYLSAEQTVYMVDYLNKKGIIDEEGNWLVAAEYDEVDIYGDLFVGRKGYSYHYYNRKGLIRKSILKPIALCGKTLVVEEDGLKGTLDLSAELTNEPAFEKVSCTDQEFLLMTQDSITTVVGPNGISYFSFDLKRQNIASFSEDFFLIRRDEKWGFVDKGGRLRIGNRYDSARQFSEGVAPVLLGNKWGFIDKDENLIIQPYYEYVSRFENGLSIISLDGKYGLIDRNGTAVVQPLWKRIQLLSSGNYLVQGETENVGLISKEGKILLRPDFDELHDSKERVVVCKSGMCGMLDYSGREIHKIEYQEIKDSGAFTMLKH